jgi:hypothetical protein
MAKWYKIPTSSRMTHGEYRANVNGMNIVFGAVLGFVLADTAAMPLYEFGVLLFLSSGAAIGVLYLESSDYKLFYAALNAMAIWLLPQVLDILEAPDSLYRLPVVFAIWAIMVLVIELVPRDAPNPEHAVRDTPGGTIATHKERDE